MATTRTLIVSIEARTAAFEAGLKSVDRSVKNFEAGINRLNRVVTFFATAGGLAYATKRVVDFGAQFVKAFSEQEQAVAGLNEALRQTGHYTDAASAAVQKAADELQRMTVFGDEALIAASTTIGVLARGLTGPELAQAQRATVALADTFKMDLNAAASLVGKAIGSTTNALTRYGIQVDTHGTQQDKLAAIIRQTAAAFAVAEARTNTTAGAAALLKNALSEVKEEMGSIIADALNLATTERDLTSIVWSAVDALKAHHDELVRWGGGIKAVGLSLVAVVRIVVNSFSLLENVVLKTVADVAAGLGRFFNTIIAPLNKFLAFVHAPFRLMEIPIAEAEAASAKAAEGMVRDAEDIRTAIENAAAAWGLFAAAAGAARARTPAVPGVTVPTVAPPPAVPAPGVIADWFDELPAPRGAPRRGFDLPQVGADFNDVTGAIGRLDDANSGLNDALAITIASFGAVGQAAIRGSEDMTQAVINAFTQILQAVVQTQAAALGTWLGPVGAIVGAVGGFLGAIFGGREAMPVRVDSFSPRAQSQLQRAQGPQRVTLVLTDQRGTVLESREILRRKEARDAMPRLIGGVL